MGLRQDCGAAERIAAGDALPVALIAVREQKLARPVLVSLAGAQGSGKSPRAAELKRGLQLRGQRMAAIA